MHSYEYVLILCACITSGMSSTCSTEYADIPVTSSGMKPDIIEALQQEPRLHDATRNDDTR